MKRKLPIMVILMTFLSFGVYAQLTAPFTEDFSSTSIPSGWSSFNDCSTTSTNGFFKYSGSLGYNASICTDNTGNSGSFAWVDGSSPYPCIVSLETDSIDVSSLTNVYLEFYQFSYNSTYNPQNGMNSMIVDFYDGSTWHDSVYWDDSQNSPSWEYIGVDLSTYSITGKVIVRFNVSKISSSNSFYNDRAIDDVSVKELPSCLFPFNFTFVSADTNSAKLDWSPVTGATGYQVIYGASGFDPATAGSIDSTTVDSITLTGLNHSSIYDAYVIAKCGPGTFSDTVGPVSFGTACLPFAGGTYTIDGSIPTGGMNFNSFADAADLLSCGGITGPVIINVSSLSTYTEQAIFDSIPGVSAVNTIRINGNGATMTFASSSSSDRHTLGFNNAHYITVKNLDISGTGTYSYPVWISGGSSHITIDSCDVSSPITSTSFNNQGIVVTASATSPTSSGNTGEFITITNNNIEGGYYGVTMVGDFSVPKKGNTVANNTIENPYYYGLYTVYQEDGNFSGNDISRSGRTPVYTFYGLYGSSTLKNCVYDGNRIHDWQGNGASPSTSTAYPMYFSSPQGPVQISNNLVYNANSTGTIYAMYMPGTGDSVNVYHNTISVDNTDGSVNRTVRGVYCTASGGNYRFVNNIFNVNEAGGGNKHAVYFSNSNFSPYMDHNVYNVASTGANYVGYQGGNQTLLTDWQTAGYDTVAGAYGDPLFADPLNGDMSPTSNVADGNGDSLLAAVPFDFFGIARTATPDRGAIEYVPLYCLPPIGVTIPADSITASSAFLSWMMDPDADSVVIEYNTCGFTQGTGFTVSTTDSSITLSGLMANTCYDVYFTSYCGGSQGNTNANPYSFTTKCLPTNMPYYEDFITWVPSCVELINGGFDWNHDANDYAEANFWGNNNATATMRMAQVNISQGAWVKFKWAHSGQYVTSYPDDQLLLRVSELGSSNWDTIVDLKGSNFASPNAGITTPPSSKTDFIEHTAFLDTSYIGKVAVFELIGVSDWGPNVFIDDFLVEAVPACTDPYDLGVTNIGADSVQVTWSSINGSNWNIEYGPTGFLQGSGVGIVVNGVSSPATINNLTPNTLYDVYVNDSCNNNWIGPFTFKTNCLSALNGAYTIGGPAGPNNFATLDSAVAELNGCGQTGPVVFNLAPGTYTGTINLLSVQGNSTTNTISFVGASAAQDTITSPSGGVVTLSDMTNVMFKNLTIVNGSGFGFFMTNGCRNISIDSCNIVGPSSTSSLDNAIIASSSSTSMFTYGDNVQNFSLTNSEVSGGYCAVCINGTNTTTKGVGMTIENNTITGSGTYGVRAYYMDSVIANNNNIQRGYPLYFYYSDGVMAHSNNLVGTTYAMYAYRLNYSGTYSWASEFVNNMFVSNGSYGMYTYDPQNMNFYHNSISGGSSYGWYCSGGTTVVSDIDIRNNIISTKASNYSMYFTSNSFSNVTYDYNIYHNGGGSIARVGSIFTDLTAWQTADTVNNINSLQGDPIFAGPNDLHILGTLPNDTGDNSVGVMVDIDGDMRPASGSTAVDIGADEFTPKQWDAEFVALLGANGGCGDSAVDLSVVVRNIALNTITSLPITVDITGDVNTTLNVSPSVNIASLTQDTVYVGNFNIYTGGVVNIMVNLNLVGDQDTTNDMGSKSNVAYLPYEPQVLAPDTVCANADSAMFSALSIPGTSYSWYANLTDTVPLANGDTVKLPTNPGTYFVEYDQTADSLLTTFAAGNGQNGNMFDLNVKNGISVTGFTINNSTSGTAEVWYRSGSFVGFESSSTGWTNLTPSGITISTTSGPTKFALPTPISLPVGTHAFYVTMSSGSVSYTNGSNPGAVYASNNDIDFLEGVGKSYPFGSTFNPRIWNGVIHYGSVGCSNIRTQLSTVLNTDSAVASGFITPLGTGFDVNLNDSGSVGQIFTWKFNKGDVFLKRNGTVSFTSGGDHLGWLIVEDTICGTIDSVQVSVLGLGFEENEIARNLEVYPNPTTGNVKVTMELEGRQDVEIRIVNLLGQTLNRYEYGSISGKFEVNYDLTSQPVGVYLLEVTTDRGVVTRRINLKR